MSLHIEPLTAEDIQKRCAGEVRNIADIKEPPAIKANDKCAISRAAAHRRFYINLNLPIINKLLVPSISLVLGIKKAYVEGLCDCTFCYSRYFQDIMPTDEVNIDDREFNGNALELLIMEFSVEDAIIDLCQTIVEKTGSIPDNIYYEVGQTYKVPILGNWGINFIDEFCVDTELIVSELNRVRNSSANKNLFVRLSCLINLQNAFQTDDAVRTYLQAMFIQRQLVIVPYAMRPKNEKMHHPLTNAYVQLFTHNNAYSNYAGQSFDDSAKEEFQAYYSTLAKYVYGITTAKVWSQDYSSNAKKLSRVEPIADVLKGKNGLIRGKMIKKRQDYSGRAAVIVDPFMSLDTLGVPKELLAKMFREYIIRLKIYSPEEILANLSNPDFNDKAVLELNKRGVFDDIPCIMGRNPSLHKHSIQAFKIVPVDGKALRVSPLVCPGYNMDFDGDTAHTEIPVSPAAANEIKQLMSTQNNILLPKTGESTICPRMDIIYGLYMCTTVSSTSGRTYSYDTFDALKSDIYEQVIEIGDIVTVAGRGTGRAGVKAFECCFPKDIIDTIGDTEPITAKSIKKYIKEITQFTPSSFVRIINNVVELGFRVAYLYSRSVSMLTELKSVTDNAKNFDKAFDIFHKEMAPVIELNDYGFYDKDSYGIEFSECLDHVNKILKDGVYDKVGDENMFTLMAKSGARGDVKNLVQIFGSKGRIQKSDSELFNVTIEHSLRDQLTPLEGFIAANGARKGQIAKSIKTADTGYMGFLLTQATSPIIITENDCGTTEGLDVSRDIIHSYLITANMTDKDLRNVETETCAIMEMFLTGRYDTDGNLISARRAKELAHNTDIESVKIRSPLRCKNPCCVKCYGIDPSTARVAVVGTPVGYIAGQSLAEPLSQGTMKEFQKGGVQGSTSPFERIKMVFNCSKFEDKASMGKYATFDPIAWADGVVKVEHITETTVRVRIEPGSSCNGDYNKSVVLSSAANIKEGVTVSIGDTLLCCRGEYSMQDALKYWKFDKLQTETVFRLWFLYKSMVELVPIHIEIAVASMCGYSPIITDIPELKIGVHYTRRQLVDLGKDYTGTTFREEILGIKSTVLSGPDFMQAMADEQVKSAINSAVSNCKQDTVSAPLVQTALTRKVKIGTGYNKNYITDLMG